MTESKVGSMDLDHSPNRSLSATKQVMMIRNEYMGYEVGVELGAMESNPLSQLDWTLDALERGFLVRVFGVFFL